MFKKQVWFAQRKLMQMQSSKPLGIEEPEEIDTPL